MDVNEHYDKICHVLSHKGFPSGATVGYAKSQVRDILKGEFNKSMELQVNLGYSINSKVILGDLFRQIRRPFESNV